MKCQNGRNKPPITGTEYDITETSCVSYQPQMYLEDRDIGVHILSLGPVSARMGALPQKLRGQPWCSRGTTRTAQCSRQWREIGIMRRSGAAQPKLGVRQQTILPQRHAIHCRIRTSVYQSNKWTRPPEISSMIEANEDPEPLIEPCENGRLPIFIHHHMIILLYPPRTHVPPWRTQDT